ncbi:hypothetical protein GIB67_015119 [Kingdonia uniflora]|uniref:Uncharacterized protein n=1 Tax=Kingdonia uniflora TaxID=39325 RepID=A0A7J7LJ26_9MAGN|nr:hypothetical protein GIB67_015119 [Kingdonia uniflora]
MVKRKAKKVVKQPSGDHGFNDHEVERRVAASQAIRDVEVEHLLTGLRLLRSNFNKEQLETPVLPYFKENMPSLELKISEEDGQFQVEMRDKDGNISISQTDERNMHAALLQQMRVTHPNCSAVPPFGSHAFLGAGNFHFPDFAMEEPSETQLVGRQDAFQTPGESSHRLSVDMTPKTRRLPKKGEMLLSVHGSPLGLYNEDSMEAIHEVEEG